MYICLTRKHAYNYKILQNYKQITFAYLKNSGQNTWQTMGFQEIW